MPSEAQMRTITTCIDFVRDHVKNEYIEGEKRANIDGIPFRIVNERIKTLQGTQCGLFLDNKIGSRGPKGQYGVTEEKVVLLSDIPNEAGCDRYFGIIFHEFGHAAFDSINRNSEHGAFTVELSCLVAAVLANVVPLVDAQDYVASRISVGMLLGEFSLVKNPAWQSRAKVCRSYLQNRSRAMISYPYRLAV